jgi:hypothetical protein
VQISSTYLSSTYLSSTYLSDADLSQAIFSNTSLHSSNFEGTIILKPIDLESSLIKLLERISLSNKLTKIELPVFTGAITDDEHLFELLQLKIKPENLLPILVKSKYDLIKELKKKSYTDDQIKRFVSQSKFS